MKVIAKTKREGNLSTWEPIYIGTSIDPLYDERLSWEGNRDKLSQVRHKNLESRSTYIIFLIRLSKEANTIRR